MARKSWHCYEASATKGDTVHRLGLYVPTDHDPLVRASVLLGVPYYGVRIKYVKTITQRPLLPLEIDMKPLEAALIAGGRAVVAQRGS